MSNQPPNQRRDIVDDLKEIETKLGGQTASVEIMRRPPGKAEFYHVTRKSQASFDPDEIARVYGGGEYKYAVRGPDGKFLAHFDRNYDPDLKPAKAAADDESAPAAAPDNGVTTMIAAMMTQQAEDRKATMNMLLTLATTLGPTLLQAMISKPAGPTQLEMIAGLKALDDMRGGSKNPMSEIKGQLDLLLKLRDNFGNEAEGGNPEAKILLKLVDKFLELAPPAGAAPSVVAAPAAASAQTIAAATAAPAPAPAAAPPPAPVKTAEVVDEATRPGPYPNIRKMLAENGPSLVMAIRGGMSADAAALEILKNCPAEHQRELFAFIKQKSAADTIYLCHRPLERHIPWLADLVECMRRRITEGAPA